MSRIGTEVEGEAKAKERTRTRKRKRRPPVTPLRKGCFKWPSFIHESTASKEQ